MGVKPLFTINDVRKKLADDVAKIDRLIIAKLKVLGEKVINHARLVPAEFGYTDRTGALRASTGYIIYNHGVPVFTNFKGSNPEGKQTGEDRAQEIASQFTGGYLLVVVAGMNYATYVESTGRDVLTSAHQLAIVEMPRLIAELTRQVK